MNEIRQQFENWIGAPPYEHMCNRYGGDAAWPGSYKRYETDLAWEAWRTAWAMQQAKIDRLMLEYCPDEMMQDQLAEFERNQGD